ncbi:MAG: hypothetical protein AUI33_13175 [Ignavibacteria bacterium 13_1_40CM_2_61_4]|nr:MAG: hypothetical protein AUI33_13175 [Ignavibacteria bacterium 13_1_40CM_2_61_4]
MHCRWFYSVILLTLVAAGCRKLGPVDLVDDGPTIAIASNSTPIDGAFGTEDIDSSRLFPPVESKVLGQLIVGGSVYDGPAQHHEASLARAIFFDRNAPIVLNSVTVGYKTLDAGNVSIDDVPLVPNQKRLPLAGAAVDTVLGVQYSLVNKDGVGGRGFQFIGGHTYQWKISGFGTFSSNVASPALLHIDSPGPNDSVSLSHNLRVRWTGGGNAIRILISQVQAGVRTRALVRLRLNSNQGGTVIPPALLQILRNERSALFTFSSEDTTTTTASGYPDQIRVTTSTTHNLLLSIRP